MLSKNLELSLHRALTIAHQSTHEYATLEHLLLALIEDPDALSVLNACGVDLICLSEDLKSFIDNHLGALICNNNAGVKPTAAFQKVIHRAAVNAHASGRKSVTGANVLAEMFGEHDSHAAFYLKEQGVTYLDVIGYLSQESAKNQESSFESYDLFSDMMSQQASSDPMQDRMNDHIKPMPSPMESSEEAKDKEKSALANYCINLNKRAEEGKIDILIGREKD